MSNDEDNATIVLDFAALKSKLKDEEELVKNTDLTLEFQLGDKQLSEPTQSKSIYFFEFQTDFFTKNCAQLLKNNHVSLIKDLKNLNAVLSSDKNSIVIFYYNSAPKIINQLCLQLNTKFTHTKKVIIAKNLSDEKAALHRKTPSKADAYFSTPLSEDSFIAKIQEL